jgi:Protein of unknown function (DUF4230)
MKRISKMKKILLPVAGLVLILLLLMRVNFLPSLGNIFYRQPMQIDDTKILIKEIRPLAQLVTVTAYDELVMDSVRYNQPGVTDQLLRMASPVPININYDELVLIAHGRIIAGTDLNKIGITDVYVNKDSASVLLPSATVLDVIINPSDFETFIEKGIWESEEVTILKESARGILQKRALQQGLLQKANLQAVLTIKNFLLAAGFKKTNVAVKQ